MRDARAARLLLMSSIVIAVLTVAASLLGLFSSAPYRDETANWRMQAWGQDVGNLLAAVVLVTSALRARTPSLKGLLVWTGTMFYLLYAYVVYAMAVHFNALFLVYTTILGLVLYSLVYALSVSDQPDDAAFPGGKPRTAAAWVLIVTGALFAALWLSEIVPATIRGEVPESLREAGLVVNPIHAIDLSTVLPGFVLTGVLALRGHRVGLFFLAPWLAFSALMGTSIVAAMAIFLVDGDATAAAPMAVVSLVVLASLVALWRFLSDVHDIHDSQDQHDRAR